MITLQLVLRISLQVVKERHILIFSILNFQILINFLYYHVVGSVAEYIVFLN